MIQAISVSLSNRCVKTPRCSFCYNKDKKGKESDWDTSHAIYNTVTAIPKPERNKVAICYEYSGYNLDTVLGMKYGWAVWENPKSVTTFPQLVTPVFCAALRAAKIDNLTISYDSEKCKSPQEWQYRADIASSVGLDVSCNFLIEKLPLKLPGEISWNCKQINLLSKKPTGKFSLLELDALRMEIELYKTQFKNNPALVLDNCLAIQLGYANSCKAGDEFIHITPAGKKEACSFKSQCFLYKEPNVLFDVEGVEDAST